MEDYNTASLPHSKYYDLEVYERRRAIKAAKKGLPPGVSRNCTHSTISVWAPKVGGQGLAGRGGRGTEGHPMHVHAWRLGGEPQRSRAAKDGRSDAASSIALEPLQPPPSVLALAGRGGHGV